MNLYVLRHGIAVDAGMPGTGSDADRPLTPEGERKLCEIAEGMQELDLDFDLILSSPYVRARRTAKIIADALRKQRVVELVDALTPSGSAKKLVDLIAHFKPLPNDVLLVGHEPYLSELISLLLSGDTKSSIVLKKGGLCKLSVDNLLFGRCASLEWLLAPKQLRKLS